uniref:SOSS complex subunit C-like isoform X1 n=1 Tax=Crassostrea virginica TaxID=6565 RepID=A0A8B8CS61_CRAVI|nr:SOSS complex subunit C-like isoform X1 [Crassostrea virginica]
MAFQTPGTGQENRNRKILEHLEEQKRRLRGGHGASASNPLPNSSPTVPPPVVSTPGNISLVMETQHMTPAQRTALQHANANSVGYFITQDSSFGNLILPVLPRFNEK